jgi:hypothetical protein
MLDCELDSAAIEADSGGVSDGPLAWFDRGSSSWRTSQGCLFEGWARFSGRWPGSGSMRSGRLYGHPTWAPRIGAPASSSWPTPTVGDSSGAGSRNLPGSLAHPGVSLTDAVVYGGSSTPRNLDDPRSRDRLASWPTPQARDHKGIDLDSRHGGASLPHFVLTGERTHPPKEWATPQAGDSEVVTPNGSPYVMLAKQAAGLDGPPDQVSPNTAGSPRAASRPVVLNPRWVIVLMGFPSTWLDGVAPPSRRPGTRSSRPSPSSSPVACVI